MDADSVDISAKSGTENYIYDLREYTTNEEDTIGSAAIYALCDLTIKGKGTLYVVSNYNNGIHTKDDLEIKNLTLNVKAIDNALKGNDSITVESGLLTLISQGGDALKTTSTDLSKNSIQRGIVTILGGTLNLYAACDGIDSSSDVVINGGDINIYTDKYSEYSADVLIKNENKLYLRLSSTVYNYNYKYSAYFYDDNGNYEWKDLTFYKMVASATQPGGRPGGGPGGAPGERQQNYYYYSLDSVSKYTNVIFYAYNQSSDSCQSDTYVGKTTSNTTIPSNFDTLVVSSISTSSKVISTTSWTSYQSSSGNSGVDYSCKGIKAQNQITITDGNLNISSTDDGIHSNFDTVLESTNQKGLGNIVISGGNIVISTSDDGIHADQDLYISGGNVEVLTSYEGLEANRVYISDGSTTVFAKDDGVNANSKGQYSAYIEFSGGLIDVTVPSGDTDTIDSNGIVKITGGTVILRNGNMNGQSMTGGTIDTDNGVTVTGGTVISIGCIGDKITNSNYNTSTSLSSGDYELKNENGDVIASFTLSSSYKAYMFYSSSFVSGSKYILYCNGTNVLEFSM